MNAAPETVAVTLSEADGEPVAEGDVTPTWGETVYPNGEECGDGCTSGEATLEV